MYKTAIIGGGASGIITAIELTRADNALKKGEVILLEGLPRIGKKLIATGNGQGNLTNANLSPENYYGDKGFTHAFFCDNPDLEEYFYSLGIPLTCDSEGRKYPLSKQASAVLDILMSTLENSGVEVLTDFKVEKLQKENEIFKITSKGKTIYAKTVVLACGGKAGSNFGTDGTSYHLATSFGHGLTALYPSLVQLKTEREKIKGLKGLKETAKVSSYLGDKLLKTTFGEVLFTDYGVSGNAIFYLSPSVVDKTGASLKIEFLPEFSVEELEQILTDKINNAPFIEITDILTGLLNKRIGKAVLNTCNSLSPKSIAYAVKNFTLQVAGSLGFDVAQVTRGGIKTDKVNPITMKSKTEKGLYIVGEMLDIDGDCGGYNLSFAFLSGIKCAKAIKEQFS